MKFQYQNQVTEIINAQLGVNPQADPKKFFHPAKTSDLDKLKNLAVPDDIMNFYQHSEPQDCIEFGDARLWDIKSIIDENENYTPGYIISIIKFVVIASTLTGDSFCLDLNSKFINGDVPVIIASHDEIDESLSDSEIRSKMKLVSKSFKDFLSKFAKAELPKDYYDKKY